MTKKKTEKGPYALYLTDRAITDLLDIESYSIDKWSKRIAAKYIAQFEKTFSLLELHPDLLLPNPAIGDSLLFYRVERHVISCVKIESDIIVLTIIHANRDLVTIIHELLPTLKEETIELTGRLKKVWKKNLR